MSTDEYDSNIERAYRATLGFADSALFDAEIAVKLEKRWIWRRRLLMLIAFVLGGAYLKHYVTVRSNFSLQDGSFSTILRETQTSSAFEPIRETAQQMGLGDVALGSFSGSQILMLSGVALTLLLLGGAVRLANSL